MRFAWFVSKNGTLLWLLRVHVFSFKAHDYCGIVHCCKIQSASCILIVSQKIGNGSVHIYFHFKISYLLSRMLK